MLGDASPANTVSLGAGSAPGLAPTIPHLAAQNEVRLPCLNESFASFRGFGLVHSAAHHIEKWPLRPNRRLHLDDNPGSALIILPFLGRVRRRLDFHGDHVECWFCWDLMMMVLPEATVKHGDRAHLLC